MELTAQQLAAQQLATQQLTVRSRKRPHSCFQEDIQESQIRKLQKTQQESKVNKDIYSHAEIIGKIIYVSKHHLSYRKVIKMMNDIAQPESTPNHINEFKITEESLRSALALNYNSEIIRTKLSDFGLQVRPNSELDQLIANMDKESFCHLYLKETKEKNYYIFKCPPSFDFQKIDNYQQYIGEEIDETKQQYIFQLEAKEQARQQQVKTRKFKVKSYKHNQLARCLFYKKIPVITQKLIDKEHIKQQKKKMANLYKEEESLHCKNLKIELKAFTKLREYQTQAMKSVVKIKDKKVYAKSGYIVLPCGAGKTLLGIAICTKIKKQTLIVCSNDSGAQQWKKQIEKWTQGIDRSQIIILTSKSSDDFTFKLKEKKPHIFITTYSNLRSKFETNFKKTVRDNKIKQNKEIKFEYNWFKMMPWGLIVFDEAQWLPAPGNSEIVNNLYAHVKVGLTATPLREDQNIKDLIYMLGTQLYIGSWKSFVELGYLANPKCIEIRTRLAIDKETKDLHKTTKKSRNYSEFFYQCNPNKIKALIFLLEYHEKLNDNIIIFCDRISLIYFLSKNLNIPVLSGGTSIEDRNFVFDMFRQKKFKTILLSRIGDQAIDLPNANVGIQINIHKGSRRQMLQRLGRIMRPKQANSSESYNAMFYTIITDDDEGVEMGLFRKRRECLVNLGFQYDLRFFQYNNSKIYDIFHDDKQVKEIVQSKFEEIIPSIPKYWKDIEMITKDFYKKNPSDPQAIDYSFEDSEGSTKTSEKGTKK